MHGVFFHFLKAYMQHEYGGKETWDSLLIANGYPYKVYFTVKEYPDEEFTSLVTLASNLLDIPQQEFTEQFGEFLAPHMLTFYSTYLKDKNWKSLELMENAGGGIHQAVKRRNPDSNPPELSTERLSPNHIVLHYHSNRRLCKLLSGMIRGIGTHFGERLVMRETECMFEGAAECVFDIERIE